MRKEIRCLHLLEELLAMMCLELPVVLHQLDHATDFFDLMQAPLALLMHLSYILFHLFIIDSCLDSGVLGFWGQSNRQPTTK